jgi:hypothetical protein
MANRRRPFNRVNRDSETVRLRKEVARERRRLLRQVEKEALGLSTLSTRHVGNLLASAEQVPNLTPQLASSKKGPVVKTAARDRK